MKAMLLRRQCQILEVDDLLDFCDVPIPVPGKDDVLIHVSACGVCHTELDEIEGRTPPPVLPIIPGHQIIGRIEQKPVGFKEFEIGDRVGVAWIFSACNACPYCKSGYENLCPEFRATGRDENGGYAEYVCAHKDFIFKIPEVFTDEEAAPLLCAGAIGYRSLKLTGIKNGQKLGLTGFGASGHQVLKLARHLFPDSPVYVYARSQREREFATDLGAAWSGDITEKPPEKQDAIIDTTPVWKPVLSALKNLNSNGRLVINAIRKENSDIDAWLELSYGDQLWMEKEVKTVANITVGDVREFLEIAARSGIRPEYETLKLPDANQALKEMKEGRIRGAKVLVIGKD